MKKGLDSWTLNSSQRLLACVLLFLASICLYSPAFKYEFTKFDDYQLIGEHPQLYADGSFGERLQQIVYRDYPREEPLIIRDITWLIDSELFGFNRPFGYHYSNVILHAMALVLGFLLVLRLSNAATALATSVILLVLAVHVEPVVWIMGRKDVLSATLCLASILSFLRMQDTPSKQATVTLYIASLLLACSAYLSKINSVILPGLIFLASLVHEPQFERTALRSKAMLRLVLKHLTLVAPFLLAAVAAFVWYRSAVADFGLLDRGLKYSPEQFRTVWLLVNPLVLLEYVKLVLVPWDLEAYYTSPSIYSNFSAFDKVVSALVIFMTLVWLTVLWQFNRAASLLFLGFLVALLPYANWVHLGFWYANRYVYFASFFLVASIACVVVQIFSRPQSSWLKWGSAVVLCVVFTHNVIYRTQYIDVWKNGETLWEHEVSLPNPSINDFNNLAANYIGRAEESRDESERMAWLAKAEKANTRAFELELQPHEMAWLPVAHYNRGLVYAYSNAPLNTQLREFLIAATTSRGFHRAERSTGVVYYQMAQEAESLEAQHKLLGESIFWFAQSFSSQGNTMSVRSEKRTLSEQIKRDFPNFGDPQF